MATIAGPMAIALGTTTPAQLAKKTPDQQDRTTRANTMGGSQANILEDL